MYLPTFILIDEGGFSSLIDNGDLADLKRFLEGEGKALKLKGKNCIGMQWKGVPIIMTCNELHSCMQ